MSTSLPRYNPKDSKAPSPYQLGNFCPLRHEGTHYDLEVEGVIPDDLDGIYVRNGTNERHLPPTGVMHMFDGDAMLHCVRFERGKPRFYANTWIMSDRSKANEERKCELYPTFGDMTGGGPEIKDKFVAMAKAMKSGTLPNLGKNRSHPSTSTLYVGGKLFCLVEVCPPFQVAIDPDTGRVSSGAFQDMGGLIEAFTAHPKTDPETDQVFWFGLPKYSSSDKGDAHYGALSAQGELLFRHDFPMEKPFPAFLHDYFITERYAIVVDHSFRMDSSTISRGSAFQFDREKNIRFGVIPRFPKAKEEIRWFDAGRCGFVWHVVNGWEAPPPTPPTPPTPPRRQNGNEKESEEEEEIVLFLNVFDFYPDTVPIHVAEEPPSHLWKYVLNLKNGSVKGTKVLDSVATERNDYNRFKTGKPTRYAYLMKRGEDREMYDGFIKFDLESLTIESIVSYGKERFGGEALFVPKPVMAKDDDGFLLDIVYDGVTGGSELCIWDASLLASSASSTMPLGRVHLPHRVPYGVHANWLSTEELEQQRDWFRQKETS